MLRRTPLYDTHVSAGGRFVPFAGWDMPVQFAGLKAEHHAVRTGVGLFDVSHMGEVRVQGAGAAEALNWLCSNNPASLDVGQAQYNLLCNPEGGVVDDVVVYRRAANDFMICVNAANRSKDFAWLTQSNPDPERVTITDEGDDWVQIAVQGPRAQEVLATLTTIDLEGLGYYRFEAGADVAGVHGCIVARTGYTGEDGFEVFIPAASGVAVWNALMEAGAEHGIMPIGLGARDTLRLEVRYCLYGHELSDETSPRQARLMWVTDMDKAGGFLGKDAVVQRKATDDTFLAGLRMEGSRIAREGMDVLVDGEVVGTVTSGTRGPTVGVGVALAYLKRPFGKPGTRVQVDVRGRMADAVVVKGPFYRRA